MIVIVLKKQIIFLISLLLLAFSSTAAAANWQWVDSNENIGVFFDTESLRFSRITKGGVDKNIIYFWSRYVCDDAYAQKHPYNGKFIKYRLQYQKLNISEETIATLEVISYDANEEIITKTSNVATDRVVPGTFFDTVCSAVKEYARIHAEEITDRSIR